MMLEIPRAEPRLRVMPGSRLALLFVSLSFCLQPFAIAQDAKLAPVWKPQFSEKMKNIAPMHLGWEKAWLRV